MDIALTSEEAFYLKNALRRTPRHLRTPHTEDVRGDASWIAGSGANAKGEDRIVNINDEVIAGMRAAIEVGNDTERRNWTKTLNSLGEKLADHPSPHDDAPNTPRTSQPDHLPQFGDAPVRDAKIKSSPPRIPESDAREVEGALPPGVSLMQSGYGKKYRR